MKRALLFAPLIPLVLATAACGDDDDATESTADATADTTATDDTKGTSSDITIPDFTIPDFTIPDFTIPDFTIPDFTIPDISIPDLEQYEEQIRSILERTGLDDEQIDCLVDKAKELGGTASGLDDLTGLFADCDVQPRDLIPGG